MNYNKNKLIDQCLKEYYATFAQTLNTGNFVPDKYNNYIMRYIFKSLKKQFKLVNKEDKAFQKARLLKEKINNPKPKKPFFKNLFKKNKAKP